MAARWLGPLELCTAVEHWPFSAPFQTAAHTLTGVDVVVVTLRKDGLAGRGEAAGVYYRNDTAASMITVIEGLRSQIEAGLSRESLQTLLPPGGARNALDCAMWDLEAKASGKFVWQLAELKQPHPLVALVTCGADSPEQMANCARGYIDCKALKLKLTGEPLDAARVRAVREARPDVWLSVDANQSFTPASLEKLMPVLVDSAISLIEQPYPAERDPLLDGFHSPISLVADESVQSASDMSRLIGRFDVVNIKLDKCGGLTEALTMARTARDLGLDTWVGNMFGTSLAMAPGYVLGQLCKVIELDGPLFLKTDRKPSVRFAEGMVICPESLWGHPLGCAEDVVEGEW